MEKNTEDKVCIVCKSKIDGSVLVETDNGYVHSGQCLEYIKSLPVTESTDSVLIETELLL